MKDENRKFESREANLGGHLSNPLGGKEVKGELTGSQKKTAAPAPVADSKSVNQNSENATDRDDAKDIKTSNISNNKDSKKKDNEDWLEKRVPNPAKDVQLKAALDLVKDPVKWNQSLGLAAKKPVKTDDKKDKK